VSDDKIGRVEFGPPTIGPAAEKMRLQRGDIAREAFTEAVTDRLNALAESRRLDREAIEKAKEALRAIRDEHHPPQITPQMCPCMTCSALALLEARMKEQK